MTRCFPGAIAVAALATAPIWVASAQSTRLSGAVTDSVHRAPLVDATVLATPIAPTRDTVFHSSRTDAKGRFELAGLQVGKYVVSVEHAFTDSIGLAVPPREVEVTAAGGTSLALALPSVTTLRKTLCPAAQSDTTLGVMLGVVRHTDGSTAGGANVVFVWTDIAADRTKPAARTTRMTASVTTDSSGVYRACGLPSGVGLLVQAQSGTNEQSGVVEERIGAAGVLVRELVLGVTARASTLASGADTNAVHGAGVVHGVVLSR
ncbi:MAG TPA: carboxypeptidase-like regulatory domain-containing protein [Gemmatimonadaceae bacterium]